MKLYLVQHGKALPREVNPDRGLSEVGRLEVETVAQQARAWAIRPSRIIHSSKTRARQTAEILESALTPGVPCAEQEGLDPLDDVLVTAQRMPVGEDVMIVGHLPFLSRLASYLVTGSPGVEICAFRHGGIVCLVPNPNSELWLLAWAIVPSPGEE